MEEFKGIMIQAAHEIETQNQELQVLRAIRDTVYAFKGAIESQPPQRGYGEDIAYRLRAAAKEIERRSEKKAKGDE